MSYTNATGIALNDVQYGHLLDSLGEHYTGYAKENTLHFPRGWDNLIADCHEHLREIIPNYVLIGIRDAVGKMAYQTGSVQLEYSRFSARFSDVRRKYEQRSASICQRCGHPGDSGNNWAKVLCGPCLEIHRDMFARRNDLVTAHVPRDLWAEDVREHFLLVEGR